ncbi:MAG: hypothetical protein WC994_03260 [Brumimicrobium sp.]
MDFTQEQITTILTDFSNKSDNGYETILKIALESMMRSEREEYKELNSAAFGFTNALLDIIKNEQPTHIAVILDAPGGPTNRIEQYALSISETLISALEKTAGMSPFEDTV